MLRQPAVAGTFYPDDRKRLAAMVEEFLFAEEIIPGVVAGVAPHAGYQYSGAAAGALYAAIEVPEAVVILGPNHRGIGSPYGMFDKGAWRTPLGDVAINEALAEAIGREVGFIQADPGCHQYEHSIEVQLPFLQSRRPGVTFVPICIGEMDFNRLVELGGGIAAAAKATGIETLVIASSDMTHYESAEEAERKDHMAIERMRALDEEGLWRTVARYNISMCGVAPAVSAIAAARDLGAAEGKLVVYSNSGDVTGDASEVVGYASMAFIKEAA